MVRPPRFPGRRVRLVLLGLAFLWCFSYVEAWAVDVPIGLSVAQSCGRLRVQWDNEHWLRWRIRQIAPRPFKRNHHFWVFPDRSFDDALVPRPRSPRIHELRIPSCIRITFQASHGALAIVVVLAAYRRHPCRLRPGCCVSCGYDLRASDDVCPECGRPFTPDAT